MRACLASTLAFTVALGAAASALAGCTSPKNDLGPNASPCFRAVAVGEDAVRGVGHFAGLRPLSQRALAGLFDRKGEPAPLRTTVRANHAPVCLIAYEGWYHTSRVAAGVGVHRSGAFALVIVGERSNALVQTVVLRRLPLSLQRVLPVLR